MYFPHLIKGWKIIILFQCKCPNSTSVQWFTFKIGAWTLCCQMKLCLWCLFHLVYCVMTDMTKPKKLINNDRLTQSGDIFVCDHHQRCRQILTIFDPQRLLSTYLGYKYVNFTNMRFQDSLTPCITHKSCKPTIYFTV